MSTLITALFIVGLILAIIEEARAQGQSIGMWGVIAIAVGLVLERLT